MKGIDCAFSLTAYASRLPDLGLGFACRYYGGSAAKDLTPGEAKALSDNGLQIVTVWESTGDNPDTFDDAHGKMHAQAALVQAWQVGQPDGSTIYFAVDFDATEEQVTNGVLPYFEAVRAVLQPPKFNVGVYGSGAVLNAVRALVEHGWLAQSRGWRGTAGFEGHHIQQGSTTQIVLKGMSVDTDESLVDDFGGWKVGEPAVSQAPQVPAGVPDTQGRSIRPTEAQMADAIKTLQGYLKALGLYSGMLDGIAGPATRAALEAWEAQG